MYQHYGNTTEIFSNTVWMLLRFDSLYGTYASRDAYSVIVCPLVRPVESVVTTFDDQ